MAVIDRAVTTVEICDHRLLGRPGEFLGVFDFLGCQEVGDDVFPAHSGIVQRRAVFSRGHFQGALILRFAEMVDFQTTDALVRV